MFIRALILSLMNPVHAAVHNLANNLGTRRQFHMEDQEIIGTTIQNSFTMAIWGSEICAALTS